MIASSSEKERRRKYDGEGRGYTARWGVIHSTHPVRPVPLDEDVIDPADDACAVITTISE